MFPEYGYFLIFFSRLDSLRAPSSMFSMGADEGYTQLKVQQYLDDVSRLNIPAEQTQWYNVDVANMLADTRIKGHEVDETSGSSLLFLERSVMLCCPESGRMHHFPKHLLHCFVDDNRSKWSRWSFEKQDFLLTPRKRTLLVKLMGSKWTPPFRECSC